MPPKVHDLKQLIDLLEKFDSSVNEIRDAEFLSMYSVRSRYPDDYEIETKEQALEITAMADKVKSFIQNKIGF